MEEPQFILISQTELDELRFRAEQIQHLNELMDEVEEHSMSLSTFFDKVANIL